MTTKRVFFALWPDDRQRDRLRDVITPMTKLVEGAAIFRGNWHVTLAFIGEFPESKIPELLGRAAEIPVEPMRLRFDRVEYWPRPKIACLMPTTVPAELARLAQAVGTLLADFDVPPEPHNYRPHITVVRRARPFETQRLAQPALTEWSSFSLIESTPVPGGSTYRPINQ